MDNELNVAINTIPLLLNLRRRFVLSIVTLENILMIVKWQNCLYAILPECYMI